VIIPVCSSHCFSLCSLRSLWLNCVFSDYTFLRTQLRARHPSQSVTVDSGGNSPRHPLALWSHLDIGSRAEWEVGVRYVDELEALLLRITAYTELETRLAWKPNRHWELAVVGNNLLDGHHSEFNPVVVFARNVQVDRAVYAKVIWQY
jgi:iron complex outermembrane receptor protein